jgi:DNA-binding NtrC family response regulator
MLVLGDCDKIVAELFEERGQQHPEIDTPKGPAQPTIGELVDLKNSDPMNNNAFSLKSVKKKAVDRVEKEVISYVLNRTDWNRSKAAKILKVSYKTLLNKISDLEIVPPKEYGDIQ